MQAQKQHSSDESFRSTRAHAIFHGLPSRYSIDTDTGCHIWHGKHHTITGRAYLRNTHGKVVIASRWILGYLRGIPLASSECALHKCDNPRCVNPEHLFVGTQAENIRDRDAKGRNRASHPTCANGHDMLDPDNVRTFGPDNKWRSCRACSRTFTARYRARKRIEAENN